MNRREYIKQTTLLLGYSVSVGAISDLLLSCKSEAKLDWKPIFLTNNQANTISEIAETICPKTTTPGAKELGVPQFIDKMLKELLSEKEQQEFISGIDDFEKQCKNAYGKSFVECDSKQKTDLLTKLDKESPKFPPNVWGIVLVEKPEPINFFRRMKSLTLMSYFTSQKIGKDVLVYDPVPGKFNSCMPYEGQNTWSE